MSLAKQPGPPRDSAPDFDQTMPPGAFELALHAGEVSVAVLSADREFIEHLWDVGHAHPSIIVVDAWPALLQAVTTRGCGIVLLDVDHLEGELSARLAELENLPAPPVVVAAGAARRAPEMMRRHAERRIHRLLVKPASSGKLLLLLGAALTRSRQPREAEDLPYTAGPSYKPPRDAAAGGTRRRLAMLAVGMAVVFAAVVTLGLGWKAQRGESPDDAPAARQAADIAPATRITDSAPVGRIARPSNAPAPLADGAPLDVAGAPPEGWSLAADGTMIPAGPAPAVTPVETAAAPDTAPATSPTPVAADKPADAGAPATAVVSATPPIEATRPAAQATADAPAATAPAPAPAPVAETVAAPEPVAADPDPDPVTVALAAAHSALDFGSLEAAEMLIEESRWLGADEAAMKELGFRLATLRDSLRRERQALLLALGRERIRNGWITVPEDDSAVHYLATLHAENPVFPGLSGAVWELTPRLVDDVRGAIAAQDWAGAEAGLERLRRIGAPEGMVSPLAVEVDVTRRQLEYLRTPANPDEMELLRTRTPVYPRVAVRNDFEGWVDFQLIVDREGLPRDIAIVGEQPAGVFSRAATEAVERYRYAPFVRDGVTYERLVRLRVEFALD